MKALCGFRSLLQIVSFALCVDMVLTPTPALAHGGDDVALEMIDPAPRTSGRVELAFRLEQQEEHRWLSDQDLAISHERKLHLFLFDPALSEFRHIHPEFLNGAWRVSTDLAVNGNYWIWAQGEIANGGGEFTADSRLEVQGGATANPLPPVLGDIRSGGDGASQLSLSRQKIRPLTSIMLTMTFSRADGSAPELTPYLGAIAHVVAVPVSGDKILHVHPMWHADQWMIHTTFPKAGDYRLWAQFVDAGVLKTVPLSVHVE